MSEKITYPQNVAEIIKEIVEKSKKLKSKQDKSFQKWVKCEEKEERKKIMASSPGGIISKAVSDYAHGKLKKEDMVSYFVKKLEVSEERARKIKRTLSSKVLPHISSPHVKEKKKSLPKRKKATEKRSSDPYREPIT